MAMKHARNVSKYNSFECYSPIATEITVLATLFEQHFQYGGHKPEVVISHRWRQSAGSCKELFYSFCTW